MNDEEIDKLLNEVFYANKFSNYFTKIGWLISFVTFLIVIIMYANSSFNNGQLALIISLAVAISFIGTFDNTYKKRFSRYDEKLRSLPECNNSYPFCTFRFSGVYNEKWASDAKKNEIVYLVIIAMKECLYNSFVTVSFAALTSFIFIKYF